MLDCGILIEVMHQRVAEIDDFWQSAEWPINPVFSYNLKPPALAAGVFTLPCSYHKYLLSFWR